MVSANEMQIGGDHYAQEYQHWDWIVDNGMGYLEGCATKYISRWRKKNGLEDLKKSRHYVVKTIEVAHVDYRNHNKSASTENWIRAVGNTNTYRFIEAGEYDEFQKDLFFHLSEWRRPEDLTKALEVLDRYIANAQEGHQTQGGAQATLPLPTPSSGPVARPCGGAGRAAPQPPGTSASSNVATMASVVGSANPEARNWMDGMEHPFGYDAEAEGFGERPEADFGTDRRK